MAQVDKPNLVLPAAFSYNVRPIDTTKDQHKKNVWYEVARNSLTGKTTVYIIKRPGIIGNGGTYGSSGDTPRLVVQVGALGAGVPTWVFSTASGGVTKVSNSVSENTIFTDSNYIPALVDKFQVSGTETVVLQCRNANGDLDTAQKVYYASAIGSWTQISDADFTALKPVGKMEFIDGFAFVQTSTNRIHNSDLNSIANWTSTSFISKQIENDVARGLIRLGRVLLAFGGSTVEGFYNAGNTTGSPLARIPQLSKPIGLSEISVSSGKRHYYANVGNKVYFAGNESKGSESSNGIYQFDGSSIEKISPPAIDYFLSTDGENAVTQVVPFSARGRNCVAFGLSNAADATQNWIIYSPEFNDWFEWNSTLYQPNNYGDAFIGIAGAASVQQVGRASDSFVIDSAGVTTAEYQSVIQFEIPSSGHDRKSMYWFGVTGDTLEETSTGHLLNVEFSDNDFSTWSTPRAIDMSKPKKMI